MLNVVFITVLLKTYVEHILGIYQEWEHTRLEIFT